MPKKKYEIHSFISQSAEEHDAEVNGEAPAHKAGRPKSRGDVTRLSLFLDADLSIALKMQAVIEQKSVSILISELVRKYLTEQKTLEKL